MIKVGIVGVRGFSVVGAMKAMPDEVKITAMCDLDEDCLKRAKEEIGLEASATASTRICLRKPTSTPL